MARFTEEDVLAKKLAGKKSKLKMLICSPLNHRGLWGGPRRQTPVQKAEE